MAKPFVPAFVCCVSRCLPKRLVGSGCGLCYRPERSLARCATISASPILQGKQLSLSPLAIIVAMTFWSWVWGIAGALIAVPLTAAVVMICGQFDRSRWIAKRLSS